MDYNSINQTLRTLRNQQRKLDVETGIQYVTTLKRSILGSSELAKVSSLIVLAKAMQYLPKSDRLFSLFDSKLFSALFGVLAKANVAPEPYKAVLVICTSFLTGSLAKNRTASMYDSLLWTICESNSIFDSLASHLSDQNVGVSSTISDFISQILYRSFQLGDASIIIHEVKCLMECHFFDSISSLPYDFKAHMDSIPSLKKSSMLILHFLINSSLKSDVFSPLTNESIISMSRMMSECGSGEGKTSTRGEQSGLHNASIQNAATADYVKIGLDTSTDLPNYIQSHFTPACALDLIYMLKSPNMTFKKNFSEHTMFADQRTYFPLMRFAIAITNQLARIDTERYPEFSLVVPYFNSDLYYSFMSCALKFWMLSKAEDDDFDRVLKLVPTLVSYCDSILRSQPYYTLNERLLKLKYSDLKKLQLKQLESDKLTYWSSSLLSFNKELNKQVLEFVRNQRFFELSKGSWVYINNPLDSRPQQGKPVYYFLTLSSNNRSLVYKEFTRKHAHRPNIDKDGAIIEFKNVTRVDYKKKNEDFSAHNLITISSRLKVSQISIYTDKGSVFDFYVDTEGKLFSWLDGLRMLMDDNSALSKDTTNQIDVLKDIRTKIQLLDLEDSQETEKLRQKPAPTFEPAELQQIASGFYFE